MRRPATQIFMVHTADLGLVPGLKTLTTLSILRMIRRLADWSGFAQLDLARQ